MRRHVAFRQCDLERAIRAAKATGAHTVTVQNDGSICIGLNEVKVETKPKYAWPQKDGKDIVL